MNSAETLQYLLVELKTRGQLPKVIQLSKFAGRYWCSIFDAEDQATISNFVYSGHSDFMEIATLKAHVERIERFAFLEGANNGHTACQTDRSDGFAAFPASSSHAASTARDKALAEATERFVWARWWDSPAIGHSIHNMNDMNLSTAALHTLKASLTLIDCNRLLILEPTVEATVQRTIVLLAENRSGGLVVAGACGPTDSIEETVLRASDELLRHGLALKRMQERRAIPQSFYESRLLYFGLGAGNRLVNERLNSRGTESVRLPRLAIDTNIPHSLDSLVRVHRCLYENQPPFVGGNLERLCL